MVFIIIPYPRRPRTGRSVVGQRAALRWGERGAEVAGWDGMDRRHRTDCPPEGREGVRATTGEPGAHAPGSPEMATVGSLCEERDDRRFKERSPRGERR